MDLLEDSPLLQNLTARYDLLCSLQRVMKSKITKTLSLSIKLFERTVILNINLGSEVHLSVVNSIKLVENESGSLSSGRTNC